MMILLTLGGHTIDSCVKQISFKWKICVDRKTYQSLKICYVLSEKEKQMTTGLTCLQTTCLLVLLYLFYFGLLKGELNGGHSQLVGKETHISRQLWWADMGSWAVPTMNAAQELPLPEKKEKNRR